MLLIGMLLDSKFFGSLVMEEQYIMYKSKYLDGFGWILQIYAFVIDSVCIM